MAIATADILKEFPELVQHVMGDLTTEATAPSAQTNPSAQSITFIAEEKYLQLAADAKVHIVVVPTKLSEIAKKYLPNKIALLTSPNTMLAMALINERFFKLPFVKEPFSKELIHPTALIDKSAQLASGVIIGPNVVIGKNVSLGAGTFIGANSVIEANASLGANCFIHPLVYIGHSCRIGKRVEIKPHSTVASDGYGYAHDAKGNHYRIPHYGEVIIGDDVHIGANVNVDRGTFEPARIGDGTKIDNHCHIGHNVQIGKNCLITAGFIVAGSTTIGDNCVFAGRVSVNGHINVTSNCQFGPLSGVTNDINNSGVYSGFPPVPFKNFLKSQATLVHLPRMRKNISRILKHLGINEEES